MAETFAPVWGSNNLNRRPPEDSEAMAGFQCGPADPDLFDALIHDLQTAVNVKDKQLSYAAAQVGKTYDPNAEDAIDAVLKSYADVIKTDLAIEVGTTQFPTIVEAMEYLSNFRLVQDVQVVINVPSNSYNHGERVIPGHPDGAQILVQGQPLPLGMVTENNFAVTGFDAGSRNADRVTNDAMLRARFPTRIICSGDACRVGANAIRFKNILFIGDGDGNGLVTSEGGLIACENVSVHFFNNGYMTEDGGRVTAPGCSASGCQGQGFVASRNGTIVAEGAISSGNANNGVQTSFGGHVSILGGTSKGNGGSGLGVSFGGTIQALNANLRRNALDGATVAKDGAINAAQSISADNGRYGYFINGEGFINAISCTATGNTTGAYGAMDAGFMDGTLPAGATTYSPAKNTVGNGNAYIKG